MWKGETFIVTHAPRAHVCPTVFLSFTNNLLNGARVVAQIGAVLPEYMFRKGALITKAALSNVDPVAPVLLGARELESSHGDLGGVARGKVVVH